MTEQQSEPSDIGPVQRQLPRRKWGSLIMLSFWFEDHFDHEAFWAIARQLKEDGAQPNGALTVIASDEPFGSRSDLPSVERPFNSWVDLEEIVAENWRIGSCELTSVFAFANKTATELIVGSDFGEPVVDGHPISVLIDEEAVVTDAQLDTVVTRCATLADGAGASYAGSLPEWTMPTPRTLSESDAMMFRHNFYVAEAWVGTEAIGRIEQCDGIEVERLERGVRARVLDEALARPAQLELFRAANRWRHRY